MIKGTDNIKDILKFMNAPDDIKYESFYNNTGFYQKKVLNND